MYMRCTDRRRRSLLLDSSKVLGVWENLAFVQACNDKVSGHVHHIIRVCFSRHLVLFLDQRVVATAVRLRVGSPHGPCSLLVDDPCTCQPQRLAPRVCKRSISDDENVLVPKDRLFRRRCEQVRRLGRQRCAHILAVGRTFPSPAPLAFVLSPLLSQSPAQLCYPPERYAGHLRCKSMKVLLCTSNVVAKQHQCGVCRA